MYNPALCVAFTQISLSLWRCEQEPLPEKFLAKRGERGRRAAVERARRDGKLLPKNRCHCRWRRAIKLKLFSTYAAKCLLESNPKAISREFTCNLHYRSTEASAPCTSWPRLAQDRGANVVSLPNLQVKFDDQGAGPGSPISLLIFCPSFAPLTDA